ncbi:MAG: ATP-binding cassette domain-containing protein [Pseudomonadota bacterium]
MNGSPEYGRGSIRLPENASKLFAPQKAEFPTMFTLAEHIIFGHSDKRLEGLSKQDFERMKECLTQAGLEHYSTELKVSHYNGLPWDEVLSGGEKQRLILARILYQKPDILLMDEPTSALDPLSRGDFFDVIKEHCPDITLVAITHDENSAEGHNHIPHMNKRIQVYDGKAEISNITPIRSRRAGPRLPINVPS